MASAAVGGGGGGAGAGAAAAAAGPASGSGATDTDLSSEIQTKDVFCLNEDSKFPHKNLFVYVMRCCSVVSMQSLWESDCQLTCMMIAIATATATATAERTIALS